MRHGRGSATLEYVDISLAPTIAVGGAAVVAAALADVLPRVTTAAALRRRATALLVAVVATVAGSLALAGLRGAVPVLAVAVVSVPRLNRVRRGAAAFGTAPHTPAPPGLRAAAAHPRLVLPIQVTAVAGLAAALVSLTAPAVLGIVLTAGGLLAVAIAVRHGLRHSRLVEGAVARPERLSRPVGVL